MDIKSISIDVSSFAALRTDSEGDEHGTIAVKVHGVAHRMNAVRHSESLEGCFTVLGFDFAADPFERLLKSQFKFLPGFGSRRRCGLFVEENGNLAGFVDKDGEVVPSILVNIADPVAQWV